VELRQEAGDWHVFADRFDALERNVERVLRGKHDPIRLALVALIAEGHLLIEDVPGVGKTMLAKAMARSIDCSFRRIQFTPDMLPTDITGVNVFNQERGDFEFRPGAVFANVVLGDEINRASPKTQSALLECMEERQVTIDAETHPLGTPFIVIATQNPVEHEGTYPLPEAQLDRFMFMVRVGYPSREEELAIMKRTTSAATEEVEACLEAEDILLLQELVRRVPVADHVYDYAARLARSTRPGTPESASFVNDWITWGAGPRASQNLILGAKARAILDGRAGASCDDVASVAAPVLRHRIITNFNAEAQGITSDSVVERLLQSIPKPTERR
jgi:MoxR-like ATPase